MKQWLFRPCNFGFRTTLKWFSDFKIEGKENLPSDGPLLVAPNHLSNLDPAIVASVVPKPPVFLAKKELFKVPPASFLLRSYGAYPVDRKSADIRALNWITNKLVNEDGIAIMFPEGTRSKEGGLLRGQPGVALLAITTGVPVVPFALTGSENLQNVMRVFKPTADMTLRIGKPFKVNEKCERPSRTGIARVTEEIMIRIARLMPEDKWGHYTDTADKEFVVTSEHVPEIGRSN